MSWLKARARRAQHGGASHEADQDTYADNGNRTTWIETRGAGAATTTTHTSAYGDPAHPHALTSVSSTGADPGALNLTYDATGNTTGKTDHDDPTVGQEITWGVEGHETDVKDKATGKHTSYVYDADGNRLLKHDQAASSTTLYVGASEYTATAGTVQCVRNYTVGDEPVATRTAAGLTVMIGDSQHTGQLAINGTTLAVVKRRFTAFGTDLDAPNDPWPNSHGYLDKTTDTSTGTTHLGAREYDPQLGRFVSVDSVLDTSDPQQMNGYAYANNSPITMTDPTGKLFAPGDGRVPTCGTGRTCRDNGYTPTPKHVWDSLQNRHVPTKAEIHAANLAAAEAAMQKWKDEHSGGGFLGISGNTWKKIGIGAGIVGTVVAVTVLTGGSGDIALAAALEGVGDVAVDSAAETLAETAVESGAEDFGSIADRIEEHLARPEIDHFGANDEMIERIREAGESGRGLHPSERNFINHELAENELMDNGMGVDDAHELAGKLHDPFSNYHPDIIPRYPEFNSKWMRYWEER